jgi:hypothetical protein
MKHTNEIVTNNDLAKANRISHYSFIHFQGSLLVFFRKKKQATTIPGFPYKLNFGACASSVSLPLQKT